MGFVALMLGRDISLSHSFPFKRKTQNCATRTGAHRHTFTFHYIHTSSSKRFKLPRRLPPVERSARAVFLNQYCTGT